MRKEINRLLQAKEEMSLANKALKDAVWQPFCNLLESGNLREARQMILDIPECSTRMLMAMELSKYEDE